MKLQDNLHFYVKQLELKAHFSFLLQLYTVHHTVSTVGHLIAEQHGRQMFVRRVFRLNVNHVSLCFMQFVNIQSDNTVAHCSGVHLTHQDSHC